MTSERIELWTKYFNAVPDGIVSEQVEILVTEAHAEQREADALIVDAWAGTVRAVGGPPMFDGLAKAIREAPDE